MYVAFTPVFFPMDSAAEYNRKESMVVLAGWWVPCRGVCGIEREQGRVVVLAFKAIIVSEVGGSTALILVQ
jgi:hypothetical protein